MRSFAILLAVPLLTGCARQPAPETVPVPTQAVVTTAPAETTVPTEITLPPETIPWQEPEDGEFVRVLDYIPDIFQELPYAGEKNFTGQVIYDFPDAYLRYGTVKKLAAVQAALAEKGYSLKIWDGFRPTSAQWRLWEICPDPTYVSDPTKGYSSHSRGGTVDITLVFADGGEVEMPTGFDDFTHYADRDYGDCPPVAAENARLLERTMKEYGFSAYFGEWWHFTDADGYDVAEDFCPLAPRENTLTAEAALFSGADLDSAILAWLEAGETVTLRAACGEFALAEARGGWGYVLFNQSGGGMPPPKPSPRGRCRRQLAVTDEGGSRPSPTTII